MKKRMYSKPVLTSEDFVPNEYVAVCWLIACTQGTTGDGKMDHTGSCSHAENNVISDNNGIITVREKSSDQGWLPCDLVSPSSWQEITPGTTVEWNTYAANGDGRVWHHKGIAGAQHPNRPNMS